MDSQFKEEFNLEVPKQRIRRRKKNKTIKPVFKKYDQHQMMLLPESLEELIPQRDLVRVVNEVIEHLNIESLINTYKGGGASNYNPTMLLKVWIYAVIMGIYSGRQLAKALRENIYFMWLSGRNQPDFRTLNRFRSGRLKAVIEAIFSETVLFLADRKLIDLKQYFIDGTTIQANSNKYTHVWKKNTEKYKEAVQKRVKEIFREIDKLNKEEDKKYGQKDLEELGQDTQITSDDIKEHVKKINKIIEKADLGKSEKKKAAGLIRKVEQKELPKIEKYEQQEKILESRNSYSKTDEDATFLRMKNEELLPAYLMLAGTQNQYIVNYTVHQTGSEAAVLINHIEQYKKLYEKYPKSISGDSIFGTEQNSEYLEQVQIDNYLKFSSFHYEQTKGYLNDKFNKDHFTYDPQTDSYSCPAGRTLLFESEGEKPNYSRYIQTIRTYRCTSCHKCPFTKQCKKGGGRRTININRKLDAYKDKMRENLTSEKGIQLRKQRNIDVEPVFADIKWNMGFTRFKLRGKDKVKAELGLISIAHNLKKAALAIN